MPMPPRGQASPTRSKAPGAKARPAARAAKAKASSSSSSSVSGLDDGDGLEGLGVVGNGVGRSRGAPLAAAAPRTRVPTSGSE